MGDQKKFHAHQQKLQIDNWRKLQASVPGITRKALSINRAVKDPDFKISRIGSTVAKNFETLMLDPRTPMLEFGEIVEMAKEWAYHDFSPNRDISTTQMHEGLRRGEDILYGGWRVVQGLNPMKNEIGALRRRVNARLKLDRETNRTIVAKPQQRDLPPQRRSARRKTKSPMAA